MRFQRKDIIRYNSPDAPYVMVVLALDGQYVLATGTAQFIRSADNVDEQFALVHAYDDWDAAGSFEDYLTAWLG